MHITDFYSGELLCLCRAAQIPHRVHSFNNKIKTLNFPTSLCMSHERHGSFLLLEHQETSYCINISLLVLVLRWYNLVSGIFTKTGYSPKHMLRLSSIFLAKVAISPHSCLFPVFLAGDWWLFILKYRKSDDEGGGEDWTEV